MKEYTKQYEDVFQMHSIKKRLLKLEDFEFGPYTADEFIEVYRSLLMESYAATWLAAVRFIWLSFNFNRKGSKIYGTLIGRRRLTTEKKAMLGVSNSICLNNFARAYVGIDRSPMAEGFTFRKSCTYVLDFFPREILTAHNPFTEPEFFKLPYEHVTLDFLTLVYQMPERMELLKLAEDRKMSSGFFMDYVLNYVSCFNEEHGKILYMFIKKSPLPAYVKDVRVSRKLQKQVIHGGDLAAHKYENRPEGEIISL